MHNKPGFIGQLFSTIWRVQTDAAPWPRYYQTFQALQVLSSPEMVSSKTKVLGNHQGHWFFKTEQLWQVKLSERSTFRLQK